MDQLVLILIIGITIIVLIFIYRKWRTNSEWTGTVVDKTSSMVGAGFGGSTGGVGALNPVCTLQVKMSNGKTRNVTVSQGVYEMFKIGDKISKHKGEFNPVKG